MFPADAVFTFAPASNGDPAPGPDSDSDFDWETELSQDVKRRVSANCFTLTALAIRHCVFGTMEVQSSE